ncbi:hypothetical protein [Mesorhizobium sp.]|uniref:hypothetical protein n=1 Tax=Mesorhizobium sp. TaxID=1871066 RepID=UPI0025C45386|nr:hypothetical protein [Mesorhizobium sp.]
MYGQQAHKDGRERIVPDYGAEHTKAWLQGFDGAPLGSELASPGSDELEAEFDDAL